MYIIILTYFLIISPDEAVIQKTPQAGSEQLLVTMTITPVWGQRGYDAKLVDDYW